MKSWLTTTLAAVLLCSAALRADVTILQTMTVEGGMASAAAASGGAPVSPKMTMRVKGMKMRTDMDAGPVMVATILDLTTKQVIVLRPDQKTATIVTPTPPATPGAAPAPPMTGPKVDATVVPTGKSQVLDGIKCDEYVFTTTMDMSEMNGPQMPPEGAAMMRGMKMVMSGSMWVAKDAPGAAEYLAFQKSAATSDLARAAAGATGMNIPGMDKMMKAMSGANGLAYLTEMEMNIEGTGQMADMMRKMGAMKITTRVTSISTDAIGDEMFKIPEGYTITKQ